MWPVTEAGARNAAALAELHGACFAIGWSAEDFERLLANRSVTCLTATAPGSGKMPAGFILISRAADEAEVITLCTHPRFRRRGVAETLMAHVIAMLEAAGTQALFLEVADDNTAALGLYRSLGFVEVGRRPGYYDARSGGGKEKQALVLRLEIGQ
jgi:ribosomal-protein-alanine N-acetyltransferase